MLVWEQIQVYMYLNFESVKEFKAALITDNNYFLTVSFSKIKHL